MLGCFAAKSFNKIVALVGASSLSSSLYLPHTIDIYSMTYYEITYITFLGKSVVKPKMFDLWLRSRLSSESSGNLNKHCPAKKILRGFQQTHMRAYM